MELRPEARQPKISGFGEVIAVNETLKPYLSDVIVGIIMRQRQLKCTYSAAKKPKTLYKLRPQTLNSSWPVPMHGVVYDWILGCLLSKNKTMKEGGGSIDLN